MRVPCETRSINVRRCILIKRYLETMQHSEIRKPWEKIA